MDKNGKPLVFISYADPDELIATALGKLVQRACTGVTVWFSGDGRPGKGCTPGKDWFADIHEHLEAADYVFTIVTPNSIDRPWIYWESGIGYVQHDHSRVVPVLLGIKFDDLHAPLNRLHGVEGDNADRLCSTLHAIARELDHTPYLDDLTQFCSEFAKETKDLVTKPEDPVTTLLSDTGLVTKDDLSNMASRLEDKLSKLVGRQETPQPLYSEKKDTQPPNPEVEVAARQAVALEKAGAALPIQLARSLATALYKSDESEAALAIYKQVVASPEAKSWDYSNLGVLLSLLNRNEEAENAYRKAIEMDPKNIKARNSLGYWLAKMGNHKEAETTFRKSVEADKKNSDAWYNLGSLLYDIGNHTEAESAYRKAIEADPKDAENHNALAYFLWSRGRFDEADAEVRRALEMDPDHCYANATLGLLEFERDRLDSGRAYYEKAVQLCPEDIRLQQKFHFEYGRALGRIGPCAEAERHLLVAKQLDCDFVSQEAIDAELAKLSKPGG